LERIHGNPNYRNFGTLPQIADVDSNSELKRKVEDIKKSRGKKEFFEYYTDFVASAANHATLITTVLLFVPTLYSIMSKLK